MNKELILGIAVILMLFLAFKSIADIEKYDRKFGMPNDLKKRLIWLSIIIPLLGFILSRKYSRSVRDSEASPPR